MNLDTAIAHDIAARARIPERPHPGLTDYLAGLVARLDPWRVDDLTRHAEALVSDQEGRAWA